VGGSGNTGVYSNAVNFGSISVLDLSGGAGTQDFNDL